MGFVAVLVELLSLGGWMVCRMAGLINMPLKQNNRKISSSLEDEVKRLRKENARLKMERDILKKATAFFASDTV